MKSKNLSAWVARFTAIAGGGMLFQVEGCVIDEALVLDLAAVLLPTLLSSLLGAPIGF